MRCRSKKGEVMKTVVSFPHEYRIPVAQDYIRSIKDPHSEKITTIHAIVKVRDLPNGKIPDKINPRSHEVTGFLSYWGFFKNS
jgi:hypothetical protein